MGPNVAIGRRLDNLIGNLILWLFVLASLNRSQSPIVPSSSQFMPCACFLVCS